MKFKSYPKKFYVFLFACLMVIQAAAQVKPVTMQQIELLLQEKNSRTPAEQKISSALLQSIKERSGLKMVEGITLDRANVNADKYGNLQVDIKADVTDELLMKIESLGGKIIYPSAEYHSIRALINISVVKTIAAYPEVKFIQPAIQLQVISNKNNSPLSKADVSNKSSAINHQHIKKQLTDYLKTITGKQFTGQDGSTGVISEGDRTHRADDARNIYGYSGEGIKIGVISDSYNSTNGAAADVKKGELPGTGNLYGDITPVTVVQDFKGGTDEGRAMLQIVHDLAPNAQLYFATAENGPSNFANNIKKLRSTYHCDIIIDDVLYFDEPPFQDGIVAQAVNTVTQDGAMYFASAGNYGALEKNSSCVYEADFNDKGSLPFAAGKKKGSVHNFGTALKPVSGDSLVSFFPPNTHTNSYILNWSDGIGKSFNDYDLFLIKADGTVRSSSTDIQNGSQDPVEIISTTVVAKGDKLVVFKDSTAKVRAIHLNAGFATYNGLAALKYATNGQTFGHSSAVNAYAVAATPATAAYPNPFSATAKAEVFSSDGPRHIFYNADSSAVTPNNFLFSTKGGTVRLKPDVTAADGVSTNVDSTTEFSSFYGTSAAAPHAGAIAALLKSADPGITTSQMRTILTSTALDIESAGYDSISGYGILQALKAMQQLNPKAYATLTLDSAFSNDADMSNHNGSIDPDENGDITVKLKNISPVNATSVTSTLTTSTFGITITQAQYNFGTIAANGGVVRNTANPFIVKVANSVVCGTIANFILTVNYVGGKNSKDTFYFNVTIGTQPYLNITAALGNPLAGSGYTKSTGTQTGRLGRYITMGSTCSIIVPNPGISVAAGLSPRKYDAYVFTNHSSLNQCVTTTLNARTADSLYTVAYNDSGFVPATPTLHFLAEPQYGFDPLTYSFNVAAGKSFTVVVHEVYSGTLTGIPYNLSVSLFNCNNSVLAVKGLNLIATIDQSRQVPLQWTSLDELNTRFYYLESSTDGIHFTSLYSVQPGTGNIAHTYAYIDKSPATGNNYYRVKEVDVNGNITYSNIAKITLSSIADVLIMPNPASTYVNIYAKTSIQQIKLFTSKGQLLQTIKPLTASYHLQVQSLLSGEYFLSIETVSGIANKKFIRQ